MSEHPEEVERGRQEALRIAAALILVDLGVLVSYVTLYGMEGFTGPAVRLALTGVLAVLLYRGVDRVRWVLIALLLYTVTFGNWGLPETWEQLARYWPSVVVLLVYLVIGRTLVYSRSLAAFMRSQRARTLQDVRKLQ